MSTSHLALVRAEIKTWERDFASKHGRDPSVQDIRDHPSIAEKYKLYKKLSKAALPAPKHCPAESVPPLPRFNPFSPDKRSVKLRHSPPQFNRNPFATPTKRKPAPCPRTAIPSPDLSPSILLPHSNANASSSHTHTTAVSRARKRLRGDPVSPSPNKSKRQRTHTQATPPSPRDSSNSDHEADQELPRCDFSSFVADSPVKAPAGGKAFKLLFDDALTTFTIAKKSLILSVAQPDSSQDAHSSQLPFSGRSALTSLEPRHDLKSKNTTSRPEHRLNCVQAKLSTQIFSTKNNPPASLQKPTFKPVLSHVSQIRTPAKRLLDDTDLVPVQSQCALIPPSPPPQDSVSRDAGRGRAKPTVGRKKLRVEDQDSDEEVESPDDITLKITTVGLDRTKHRRIDDLEWDPLLHLRTHNHDPSAEEQVDATRHAFGTLSVDLPDKFRRVLAISPLRSQNNTEERVVRGLLYGDRIGHYDPSRGGDIWDAGEMDDGTLGDAETEDDWEGEPVPWEVGEL